MKALSNFKSWLKRRTLVRVHLKSGTVLKVRCESFTIRKDGGELVMYQFENMQAGSAQYIRIEDVSAITYVWSWL